MSLFGEVKCGRCDRRYSAIRGKCPYCGARRKKSKDVEESGGGGGGNRKWQLIAGVALLAIIVIAVIVLIWTSLKPNPGPSPTPPGTSPTATPPISVTSTPIPTNSPVLPTSPLPTPTSVIPTAIPGTISKVEIDSSEMYYPLDLTLTGLGATYTLRANVTPAGTGTPVTWRSDDTCVATVSSGGVVTAVGDGIAYVYASCGGVESAKCVIRVTGVGGATPQPSGAPTLNYSSVTLYVKPVVVNGVTADWSSFRLTPSSSSLATYTSSDTSIATVTAGGLVQAVKGGTCTIYVDIDGYTLSCTVYVWTEY